MGTCGSKEEATKQQPLSIQMPDDLFTLLNLDPYCEEEIGLDDNTILNKLKQNPLSAAMRYDFDNGYSGFTYSGYPLHQAIRLKASIIIIKAIYNCYSPALKEKCEGGDEDKSTALLLAFAYSAPNDVALFVFHKWPEAVRIKDRDGYLPLHYACYGGFPVEVVSLLLDIWPDSIREKSDADYTPLHCACDCSTPTSVVTLLLDSWSGAVREKNQYGCTPLHMALSDYNASIEKVSLLLDQYSDALREKDNGGRVPLHYACQYDAPLEVILALLENFPEAVREKDKDDNNPLDLYKRKERISSEDTKEILSLVFQLCEDKMDNDILREIMDSFLEFEWWNGVALILDRHPSFYRCLVVGTKLFPRLLSVVGRRCMMKTLWNLISNELDIMEGI